MLTLCSGCHQPLSILRQPLCEFCRLGFEHQPHLCQSCGHPTCLAQTTCEQPWKADSTIHGYFSPFFYTKKTRLALMSWKRHRSFLMHRFLTRHTNFKKTAAKLTGHCLVPIPQAFDRVLTLGHSPPLVLAKTLSRILKLPVFQALRVQKPRSPVGSTALSQAKKNQFERSLFRPHFESSQDLHLSKVILVDDFLTTGETIRSAAQALRKNSRTQCLSIEVFVLGIRPGTLNRFPETMTQKTRFRFSPPFKLL